MRARIRCLAAALAVVAVACGGEETPTCSDGKRNGAETDVDCGGGCPPCADGLNCGGANDCQSGACGGGVCLRSVATACTAPGECASGFCADGVCCATDCAGPCRSCNAAGTAGTCTLAPAGTDAKGQCPDEGAASCGLDGLCDGAGACRIYAAGTQCAAASCVNDLTAQPAGTCDGAGTCDVPAAVACQPLVCSGGACLQTCVNPGDCAPGYECTNGVCLKQDGQACSTPGECAGGFCADGFCCESACGGTCERCDQSGREGFCDAAPAGTDPDDECPAEATATCGFTGVCSGSRACALFPAGATCVVASCAGATSNLAHACDGAGTCLEGGTADCTPYLCSAATGLCPSACATSGECVAGFYCDAQNLCVAKLVQGSACGGTEQCAGGFCVDAFCCESACGGTCERCGQPGREGFCDAAPAGTDPDDECPAEATATCRFTGVCSGARACALFPAGAICAFPSCSGNTSNLADTCDGAGHCADGGTADCAPYLCVPATGLCAATCAGHPDCAPSFYCSPQGQCLAKKGQGVACGGDEQCLSTFCTDGFCCNAACNGACRRCDQQGQVGICAFVPTGTDPDNDCIFFWPPSTCANGQCLRQDDQPCSASSECAHNACCGVPPFNVDSFCRDLASNPDYCGDCSLACSSAGVAVRYCIGGTCVPECRPGYLDCDGDGADGCDTDLHLGLLDYCMVPVLRPTDWSICGRTACRTGLTCISPAPAPNPIDAAPGRTITGNGSALFVGKAPSCPDGCGDFQQHFRLTVPWDADYDLYFFNADVLYGDTCVEEVASANAGNGVPENALHIWEFSALAIPTFYLEVRWKAGGSCGNDWTLEVFGASCD